MSDTISISRSKEYLVARASMPLLLKLDYAAHISTIQGFLVLILHLQQTWLVASNAYTEDAKFEKCQNHATQFYSFFAAIALAFSSRSIVANTLLALTICTTLINCFAKQIVPVTIKSAHHIAKKTKRLSCCL